MRLCRRPLTAPWRFAGAYPLYLASNKNAQICRCRRGPAAEARGSAAVALLRFGSGLGARVWPKNARRRGVRLPKPPPPPPQPLGASDFLPLGPSCCYLGLVLGYLGPGLAHLGPVLAHLGPVLGPSWASLGPPGACLGSAWACLGSSWGCLGSPWACLGSFWGLSSVILGQ